MPSVTTPPETAAALWKPILFRAVVALVFGLVSVFWPGLDQKLGGSGPSDALVAYTIAGYLVLTSKAAWDFAQAPVVPSPVRGFLGGAAIAWSLAAAYVIFVPTAAGVIAGAGTALLVAGVVEVAAWARHRRELVPARELLITGVIGAGTGVSLYVGGFNGLDAHGILGLAGGGAVIIGVFLAIAAFGYRHDARRA
ncbi:hypothetical protein ACQ3I4_08035 [Zafaria sp. Z1313]|uniref:hypothetical protein n=1 Tax=Zafaria sp. Z1313 TaxID=3423202 RepID=UPI003D303815